MSQNRVKVEVTSRKENSQSEESVSMGRMNFRFKKVQVMVERKGKFL